MNPWALYFDGLCEPHNPGGWMCYGWALDAGGELVTGRGGYDSAPENTNNVAEYLALYYGLKTALSVREATPPDKYPGLLIKGDSQLVCKQIEKLWQVKQPRLQRAHARCLELAMKLAPYLVEWIPRDQNQLTDRLSREAYTERTGKTPPERRKSA